MVLTLDYFNSRLFSCMRIGKNLQHLHHRLSMKGKLYFVSELLVRRVCSHVLSLFTNCRYFRDTVIDDFPTGFFFQLPVNSFICKADSSPLSSSSHQRKLTCTRFQDQKTCWFNFSIADSKIYYSLFPLSTTRYYSNILLHPPAEQN